MEYVKIKSSKDVNTEKFKRVDSIRSTLMVVDGNNFFFNVNKRHKKSKVPITKKQYDASLNIMKGNSKFKKLTKLAKSFKNYDESYKSYLDKIEKFAKSQGKRVSQDNLLMHTILSDKDNFTFLRKIKI